MTRHLHEEALKVPFDIEDAKVDVVLKNIDHSMRISDSNIVPKPKGKMKVRTVKSKMTVKKTSRLEKVTSHLYDLEDAHGPEKPLNIDFCLYQMEDY